MFTHLFCNTRSYVGTLWHEVSVSRVLRLRSAQFILSAVEGLRPSGTGPLMLSVGAPRRSRSTPEILHFLPLLHKAAAVLLLLLLPLFVVLFSPTVTFALTSTLTIVDNEPVDIAPGEPGPGDNIVVAVRRDVRYVVSLAFTTGQPGEIVTHKLNRDGTLDFVGRTPAGREPRQTALARNGDYAVVVNSIDDELAVFSIGDNGLLREVSRTSSGGDNPYDVAVAYGNIVLAANRDSNTLNTFHLDRRGRLTPVDVAIPGVDPHVVSVSSRGLVSVANQTERSVSIFHINRRGELTKLGANIPTDGMTPQAATWHGHNLYVALDRPFPNEDVIRAYRVLRNGTVEQLGDTPAGPFLTDIEANADGVFAVTANINNPPDPLDDRNEVRAYRIENGTDLILDASVQTDNFPPSFQQISTARARGPNDWHVIVTQFQAGLLWSFFYNRGDNGEEEDEED